MKLARCTVFVLYLVIGGIWAHSQEAVVPFAKIQRDSALQSLRAANDPGSFVVTGSTRSNLSTEELVSARPVFPANHRIIDRPFLLLNGAHLGMAIFDIEMTQHCVAEHKCREGNPIMPSSQAGQISVSLGLVTYTAVGSYWLKKHRSKVWWIAPTVGIAAHTAGLATGLAHQ